MFEQVKLVLDFISFYTIFILKLRITVKHVDDLNEKLLQCS